MNPKPERLTIRPSKVSVGSKFGSLGTVTAAGDVAPIYLDIHPLTVLIGPQGSGKSLLSQFVYFLRNWRFLIAEYGDGDTPEGLVRSTVERLRSGRRAIAGAFIEGSTHHVTLARPNGSWALSLNPTNRKITPLKNLAESIEAWISSSDAWRRSAQREAVFIPAERTFFSRFINTPAQRTLYSEYLPITMLDFTGVLMEAGETILSHQDMPELAERILGQMRKALRGEVKLSQRGRFGQQWQWVPTGSGKAFEIEMAASGQMAGWPLYQTLLGALLSPDKYPKGFTFHIEEPEIHLHPLSQRAVMESVIAMVNQGYKVFITTHSLTVLRTVSLAMQRWLYGKRENIFTSIAPELVAAYYLDETVRDIKESDGRGFIDERHLGGIDDELGSELYTLWYGGAPDASRDGGSR